MLKIIYEDNHIIVVEKPVNVPSQSDKTGDKDLLTMIKEYLKEKYHKQGEAYLGLVHRLDRPVGGVMVYAKTSKAAARLSEQIRQKQFSKKCILSDDCSYDLQGDRSSVQESPFQYYRKPWNGLYKSCTECLYDPSDDRIL